MEHILKSKKGVSMAELIAYVALYGVVMSLLASLVYTIVVSARKVDSRAILNRGSAILYTEILSETIRLNPDTTSGPIISSDNNTISVTFTKRFYYTDEGERKSVSESSEYQGKVVSITYSYTKGNDNIDMYFVKGDGSNSTSQINLNYGITITSHNSDDIRDVFSVDTQNSSNKYVTFHGDLHYGKTVTEFNFIVPVFVAKD